MHICREPGWALNDIMPLNLDTLADSNTGTIV
jgi:hypothetical protein